MSKKTQSTGKTKEPQTLSAGKTTESPKATEYPAGLKWTKQRKRVYEILKEATQPLSAAMIYARLEGWEQEQYAISTIYRILAAFEESRLVEKTTWIGEGTVVYELSRPEHVHYAVCLDCHRRIPLEHCPLHMAGAHVHVSAEDHDISPEAEDFTVVSHKIELYGYCKDCKAKH
ncbi:MAG: transcriptional repressor [Lachnospiraceae bacterium]|nr:transcriptional repressor [Lachnospiraceae bacterium]